MLNTLVKDWIAKASTDDLTAKLKELQPDTPHLSPRDVETRTQLVGAIKAELAKRAKKNIKGRSALAGFFGKGNQ